MFNLESSIANWRQQMLAAGIQSPVPLEELEIHLREEIDRQLKTGAPEHHAFETAVAQMGRGITLKSEFKKAGGFAGWLTENKYRILGILWCAFCSAAIFQLITRPAPVFYVSNFTVTPHSFAAGLLETVYILGAVNGILLLGGDMRSCRFLRLLACFTVLAGVTAIILQPLSLLTCIFTVFGLASIPLLRPPHKMKKATN